MSIKVTSDDYGLQRLRADNLQPRTATQVSPVQASRAIHPPLGPPRPLLRLRIPVRLRRKLLSERRRLPSRRRNERRHRLQPVLLDTRTYRERRRTLTRRQREQQLRTATATTRRGIDTEV